jgi:flagellar basal body-associated protein FliL
MKKQNLMILAGAALVFWWLSSQEKAKAQTNKVYASHQYAPVWQGLPSDNVQKVE